MHLLTYAVREGKHNSKTEKFLIARLRETAAKEECTHILGYADTKLKQDEKLMQNGFIHQEEGKASTPKEMRDKWEVRYCSKDNVCMITEVQDNMSLYKFYIKFEKICDRTKISNFKQKYQMSELVKATLCAAETHGITNIPSLMLHLTQQQQFSKLRNHTWFKFKSEIKSVTKIIGKMIKPFGLTAFGEAIPTAPVPGRTETIRSFRTKYSQTEVSHDNHCFYKAIAHIVKNTKGYTEIRKVVHAMMQKDNRWMDFGIGVL